LNIIIKILKIKKKRIYNILKIRVSGPLFITKEKGKEIPIEHDGKLKLCQATLRIQWTIFPNQTVRK